MNTLRRYYLVSVTELPVILKTLLKRHHWKEDSSALMQHIWCSLQAPVPAFSFVSGRAPCDAERMPWEVQSRQTREWALVFLLTGLSKAGKIMWRVPRHPCDDALYSSDCCVACTHHFPHVVQGLLRRCSLDIKTNSTTEQYAHSTAKNTLGNIWKE